MPLSTVLLFRVAVSSGAGHVERVSNPEDERSFLLQLTPSGNRLLRRARPAFRERALAVEAAFGQTPSRSAPRRPHPARRGDRG